MKKLFSFFVLLIILLMSHNAFAEAKLTQSVVDLINSRKYLIRFELDVDTTQKPHAIVNSLRQRSKIGIFVENMTNDSVELAVS